MTRPEPAPIVAGSHDPLLEWALRESGSGLATLAVGSEAGLARFVAGEADRRLPCICTPWTTRRPTPTSPRMPSRSDLQDAVMIGFCRREQGFLLAPGNPLKIRSIDDVIAKRARIAMRPKGAGAQLLLLSLLHRAKATLDQLAAVSPVCPTGPDIAQAIRAGRADTGIATRWRRQFRRARFRADRLGAVRPGDAPARLFPSAGAGPGQVSAHRRRFAARAQEMGGYDLAAAGTVRFVV